MTACQTPGCVRPDHLILASSKDVAKRAYANGRMSKGAKHRHAILSGCRIPGAKLAAEEVRMILTRHQQGHPHPVIAKAYGVSASAVRAIATGRTWTHVTGLERRP